MALADFERPVHNAIRSTFITWRAAARHMIRQRSGVILAFGGHGPPIRDYNIGGFPNASSESPRPSPSVLELCPAKPGTIRHRVRDESPAMSCGTWSTRSGRMVNHANSNGGALDDPDVADREYEGMFGKVAWAQSVDRFVSGDVLIHTWDLARALGVDSRVHRS